MNCNEMKREIAEMSVDQLADTKHNAHLASCEPCRSYLQDMLLLSSGLEKLVIPRPVGMHPPALQKFRRDRLINLIAAVLALLVFGALAAEIFTTYFAQEPADGPGTRESIFFRGPESKRQGPN